MKSGRELLKKTSDAHSPAPKMARGVEAGSSSAMAVTEQSPLVPASMAQAMEAMRAEMSQITLQNKSDMSEMRERLESVGNRLDSVQTLMEATVGSVA